MRVVGLVSAEEFLERAEPLLLTDEARHNLALGILATVTAHPEIYPVHRLWLVEREGSVVGAALRTPPHNLVLARPSEEAALTILAATLDDNPPGVTGALPEADAFASAWCAHRPLRPRVRVAHGVFSLERVIPVAGVVGHMRQATELDRATVSAWYRAFVEEALPSGNPSDNDDEARRERQLDVLLRGGADAGIALWEDGGEIVSLAGFGGRTPNGIRIGPVYTPPNRRRNGYASALTAALSTRLLESGRRFCFLHTDLANPTSNKIYRAIGYEHVCDAADIAFDPASR